MLEFKDVKKEDWLEWMKKSIEGNISSWSKHPDASAILNAIDEDSGKIVGSAVWGWNRKVSYILG